MHSFATAGVGTGRLGCETGCEPARPPPQKSTTTEGNRGKGNLLHSEEDMGGNLLPYEGIYMFIKWFCHSVLPPSDSHFPFSTLQHFSRCVGHFEQEAACDHGASAHLRCLWVGIAGNMLLSSAMTGDDHWCFFGQLTSRSKCTDIDTLKHSPARMKIKLAQCVCVHNMRMRVSFLLICCLLCWLVFSRVFFDMHTSLCLHIHFFWHTHADVFVFLVMGQGFMDRIA